MKNIRSILILSLVLLLPSSVLAARAWEEDYMEFIETRPSYRNHFRYNTDPLRFFLFDMDKDGIPELIIHTIDSGDFSYNIYSYNNKKLGRIYGELTLEGENVLELGAKGEDLIRIGRDGESRYFERLVKKNNRIVLEDLAQEDLDGASYRDGEGARIGESSYRSLTETLPVKSFGLDQMEEAIEAYLILEEDRIHLSLNGENLPKESPIINREGTNYYPFRALLEGAGARVSWDGSRRVAKASLEGDRIDFPIDMDSYMINGKERELGEGRMTFLYRDRTYIPIRDLMEDLGFKVFWNKLNKTIELIK